MTTLKDFQIYAQALQRHDWTHEFSDDHSVWKRGNANEKVLRDQANTNVFFMQAFTCWTNCMKTDNSLFDRNQRDDRIELIAAGLLRLEQATA